MSNFVHILKPVGTRAAGLLLAMILLAGCNGGQIIGPNVKLGAGENDAAFIDRVSSLENVSENEAFQGILFLLGVEEKARTFKERIALLRERNIVDASWDFSATRPITRGKYGYMIYQASKMPGGVILTLTGPSQRYCLRELQYRNVMVQGATYMAISGLEYISVLSRADTFMRTGKVPGLAGDTEDL